MNKISKYEYRSRDNWSEEAEKSPSQSRYFCSSYVRDFINYCVHRKSLCAFGNVSHWLLDLGVDNRGIHVSNVTIYTIRLVLYDSDPGVCERLNTRTIDTSPYRLISDLGKSRQRKQIPEKNLSTVVKFQNLVAKSCKIRKI